MLDDSIEAGVAASSLPLASHARRERWLLSLEAKKEGGGQAPRTQTIGDDDETRRLERRVGLCLIPARRREQVNS